MAQHPSLEQPETSIVIRTRNEARYFGSCLDALSRQSYRNYEIIVVDSESNDDTLSLAKKHGALIVPIKVKDFSYGKALNRGIEKSKGKYIVSLSAHAIPAKKTWLYELVSPLKKGDQVGITFSRQIPMQNAWKHIAKDQGKCWPYAKENPNVLMSNASSAFKKSIWKTLPFDETLTGSEDCHWARQCLRKGFEVQYICSSVIHHSHNESYRQVKERFFREGIANIRSHLFKSPWTQFFFSLAQFLAKILADLREFILFRYAIIDLKRAITYRTGALVGGVKASLHYRKHDKP